MTSSLTTFDGFPRDDIDIAQGTALPHPGRSGHGAEDKT